MRSGSCQLSSYCGRVMGMTICLAPRGGCGVIDERGGVCGVVPALALLRPSHGVDALLGAARGLRRGRFSFTIHGTRGRSRPQLPFLLCGKKKDDENAAAWIPGTSIPA